jgi:acyl-CoA dehydrogenase
MAWDFETEPEFQRELEWMTTFVRDEVEPLDLVLDNPYDKSDARAMAILRPLQEQVKERGLWACHLGPDLGGPGYGQLKLALMNEVLGRSGWAPSVFGCQAPDSGNAEILAHYGSEAQKARYLQPLLDGEISSCYSMTEPHAGADPTLFKTHAVLDGDEWVINGEKWFSSNARYASFLIVMLVTDPDKSPYEGMSMVIVPRETPGVNIQRNVGVGTEPEEEGSHGYIRYEDVRVPKDHVLGNPGSAFVIAQTRLGGGRLSRETREGKLASLQMVQEKIADSWIEIEQFRLLVLRTAWLIDRYQDYKKVRKDIAAVKVAMPKVYHDVVQRAMQIHGALGISNEMPFARMMVGAQVMAIADGPTEVHKITVARQVLRDYKAVDGLWPSEHLPTRRAAARERYAHLLEQEVGNL